MSRKMKVRVSLPATTNVVYAGIDGSGGPIGYTDAHAKRVIEVDPPSNIFLDNTSDLLGTSVSYRLQNGVFHQNPVYHHKLECDGDVVVSYDKPTVWLDPHLAFKQEEWFYEDREQEYHREIFTVRPPFASFDVLYNGQRQTATAEAVVVHLYVGTAIVEWSEAYLKHQIIVFGCATSLIGKCGDRLVASPGYFNPGSSQMPSSDSIQSKFNEELKAGYVPISRIFREIREYISLHVSVASRPSGHQWVMSEYLSVGSLPSDEEVSDAIRDMLPSFTASAYASFHSDIPWSELAADAYKDIGYADNNGIAYLKEASELKQTTLQYASTLRSVANTKGVRRAKALAAAYLGVHYGYKLTLLDTANYIKTLRKNRLKDRVQRCAAIRNSVTADNWQITARYQVYYQTKDWGNPQTEIVNNFLQQVDLLPTPENIWDLVPYSFVIDWFTNIGESLTSAGNVSVLQMYNKVLCRTQSTRAVRELTRIPSPSGQIGLSGHFVEIIYERSVSPYPLAPNPYSSLKPASPLQHITEGAALVVQKVVK